MGAAGMSPYLADLNNPALRDQAMGLLAQETNDALGGMDPKVLTQALEQMRQLKPQDLLQLLMLLDPELQQMLASILGARSPAPSTTQPRGWAKRGCGGGGGGTGSGVPRSTGAHRARPDPSQNAGRNQAEGTRRTETPRDPNRPVATIEGTNVPRLDRYAPGSQDAKELFRAAIRLNNERDPAHPMPESWADSPGLHNILARESNGEVGRPNYTYGARARDHSQWASVQEELRNGQKTTRSSATGLGQLLLSNVDRYYPDGRQGIGDPLQEAAGMLRYIQDRYGTPDNAWRLYGTRHEGY